MASVAGLALAQVGLVAGLFPSRLILPGDLGIDPSSVAVLVTFLAFCQYLVLSLLTGRVSLPALMWIPVTAVITVAGSNVGAAYWSSSGPIRDLALLQFIFGPPLFPALVVPLGLAQGILLARLFDSRSVLGVWLSATVLAAAIIGPASGLALGLWGGHAVPFAWLLSGSPGALILAVLGVGVAYGAVTGAALVMIANGRAGSRERLALGGSLP